MEVAPVPDDLTDADGEADEGYINDAAWFSVTRRVEALFPKIDVDPTDEAITGAELAAWNLASTRREVLHPTTRELELHDRDAGANGSTGKLWKQLLRHLRTRLADQCNICECITSGLSHAIDVTREAIKDGADAVIVVGSDGTLHEVVKPLRILF